MKTQVYGVRRGFLVEMFLLFAALVAVMLWNPCRAAHAAPPEPQPTCTTAKECAKMRRQLVKEEAKEALLVQARAALRKLARDPRLVDVVLAGTTVAADSAATPPVEAKEGLNLKDAIDDEWDADQVYRATIALEDDAGNSALLDPEEVDVTQLEMVRLQEATRAAQRKLVTNDETKLSYVKLALAGLQNTLAVATASPAVERSATPGKKSQGSKRRAVAARAPASGNGGGTRTAAASEEPAPNCAVLCVDPASAQCQQKCGAWAAGHNGGR